MVIRFFGGDNGRSGVKTAISKGASPYLFGAVKMRKLQLFPPNNVRYNT